jgi:hypothetical protein
MIVLCDQGGQVEGIVPVGTTDAAGQFQAEVEVDSNDTISVLLVRGFDRGAIGDDGLDLDPDNDNTYDVPIGDIIDQNGPARWSDDLTTKAGWPPARRGAFFSLQRNLFKKLRTVLR